MYLGYSTHFPICIRPELIMAKANTEGTLPESSSSPGKPRSAQTAQRSRTPAFCTCPERNEKCQHIRWPSK